MHRLGILTLILLLAALASCGGPRRTVRGEGEKRRKKDSSKIEVQAFLYDAKFLLQGRRRSVRLEIFKDGDRIAMAGRGYLGKTALKGWMTTDSLLVYFPSSNEYIYESTAKLLASSACLDSLTAVNFPALFTSLASEILPSPEFLMSAENKGSENNCVVRSTGCEWEIALSYKTDKRGCRLKTIKYDSTTDQTLELEAKLRTFKHRASIKASRFEVLIPDDARRITP